ncbi:MAG: CdaR family protein, partial [Clostridiales bacterium]|nr:CdaR family protein [Clostridiales bacterium]
MKKTSRMRNLYNNRVFWMVISLLASLAIWVYITSVDSDEYKQTFRGVRVELVGEDVLRESKGLVVTDLDTNSVTVDLVGPRRVIASLDSDDIVAQVDVSKLSQAAYTSLQYTLAYPDKTDTGSIQSVRKSPETVNFMVSAQTSKTVQVRGSFEGQLAEGYTAEIPVFEPSTITIYGPEAYIKNVSYAWVTFGKENVDSTYSVETGYTLMNENGEECSTTGITCSADVVKATLPLLTKKEVLLSVDLIEGAGATSKNTKVTIEPESITLAGDSAILDGLNKITIATIDLTDFGRSFTDTFTIPLNDEIRNLTGVSEATVTVEIVGLETRNFTVKNIRCTNVAEGYAADIITESVTVTLRGPAE